MFTEKAFDDAVWSIFGPAEGAQLVTLGAQIPKSTRFGLSEYRPLSCVCRQAMFLWLDAEYPRRTLRTIDADIQEWSEVILREHTGVLQPGRPTTLVQRLREQFPSASLALYDAVREWVVAMRTLRVGDVAAGRVYEDAPLLAGVRESALARASVNARVILFPEPERLPVRTSPPIVGNQAALAKRWGGTADPAVPLDHLPGAASAAPPAGAPAPQQPVIGPPATEPDPFDPAWDHPAWIARRQPEEPPGAPVQVVLRPRWRPKPTG